MRPTGRSGPVTWTRSATHTGTRPGRRDRSPEVPLAVRVRPDEARAERRRREHGAPGPDVDGRAHLGKPAAQEAIVQVRLIRNEHLLAVLEPARDDERRVHDRDRE